MLLCIVQIFTPTSGIKFMLFLLIHNLTNIQRHLTYKLFPISQYA